MKACILKAVNQIEYIDVENPAPKEGEVLLDIKACGICSSDIDRIRKTGTYHFPTIPGHEFAGVIAEVGAGVDKEYIGKKAAVFPLLPCGRCDYCKDENYALCENYNYFGSRCDGGFAELIAVPVWNLVFFDDRVDLSVAAMCEPTAVALHAVNKADVTPDKQVLIIGTGTIGILAALWVRSKGGIPVILGRSEKKREPIESFGIRYECSITDTRFDSVIECVGGEEAVNNSLNLVKKGGTVVLTGNPTRDILLERTNYWAILRKELSVRGTWNSSYRGKTNDWKKTAEFLTENQESVSRLITHKFKLDQLVTGLETIENKNINTIKVMIVNE